METISKAGESTYPTGDDFNIPDGIYGRKLHSQLWQFQYAKEIDRKLINFLLFILKLDLLKIDEECLKKAFKNHLDLLDNLDIMAMTTNQELVARCLEVKILLNRKHVQPYLATACDYYWNVFNAHSGYEYLVRHLGLIKLAKAMFKDQIDTLFEKVKPIVLALPYPYWQFQVLKQLPPIFTSKRCRDTFESEVTAQLAELTQKRDYTGAQWSIESLAVIGVLTENGCAIRRAELLEKEADEYVSEKKPNTFYPTISQKYSNALKLILDVSDCQELRARLMRKLQAAQLEDALMLQAVAADLSPTVNVEAIHQSIVDLKLENYEDAFTALLGLPIIPAGLVDQAAEIQERDQSFIAKLFSDHVKLSALGKPIGFKYGKDAKANQLRMQQREVMIVMIKMFKDVLDIFSDPLPEAIFETLKLTETLFIPQSRLILFTDGLYAGFENDFVTASHLLVPQIEHSLRHIAQLAGISVTNYNQKEEFENTLGGTLEKMIGIIDEDIRSELKSFLIDSSNVNFRNELLHGNLNSNLIQHYGCYLWWLILKMVFQTNRFFNPVQRN